MFYRPFVLGCLLLFVALSGNTEDRSIVYNNAVTMDGHPINYDALPMYSRGVLAFVSGDPRSPKHKPMLFQVTLRRSGKAVQQWSGKKEEGIYSIQLDEIWPLVQLGDELVVEPVYTAGETHKPGKRVFKLGIINLFTWNKC
ncbi:hypothetical protein SAMN06269250_2220 [Spirosoma fluviale]|uniref:Uncharacterized protein n=2 Tax=Spirosoma fluviale TaxID=1597977 RepID=A0A286FIR9_9BACT|nr:hypothetical protein SAMN06269250_2220 [Spirosoma fluviale]